VDAINRYAWTSSIGIGGRHHSVRPAWHDLIANLRTLTINEVRMPIVEHQTLHLLSRPTALQEQIYALLGVPTPRVQ